MRNVLFGVNCEKLSGWILDWDEDCLWRHFKTYVTFLVLLQHKCKQ